MAGRDLQLDLNISGCFRVGWAKRRKGIMYGVLGTLLQSSSNDLQLGYRRALESGVISKGDGTCALGSVNQKRIQNLLSISTRCISGNGNEDNESKSKS